MEVRRVIGRLAPRWPLLVLIGLIGAIGAFLLVQQRNSQVQPEYRADASVAIAATETEEPRGSSNAVSDELATALELAQTVNEEEVRRENRFITADGATNSLIFGAVARTSEAAVIAATSMRSIYVDADPNFDVNAELEMKLAEAALINGRLEDLLPDPPATVLPTPEEAASSESVLTILQAEEAAINANISELTSTKVASTDSDEIASLTNQIEAYRADLEALLIVLRPLQAAAAAEADETAAAPDAGEEPDLSGLPFADQWSIQALNERLAELQTESASLIIANVTGADIELPDAEVIDESPSITPTWLGLLVGFLAGLLVSSGILLAFDRARGVVWQAGDVKNVTVLAEGPAISMGVRDATDLELHRRKRSVQAIRSAIIGAGQLGHGTIVGFASPPSTDEDIRDELAFDVGASVSAVGRSVLIVDLGFTGSEVMGPTRDRSGLRELFDSVADDEITIRERATAAIQSAEAKSHGLHVLTADSDVIDPADILAGRPLTELLNQARDAYDIVLVVQPTTTVNTGAGVDAYLQQQVIVCTKGKTRVSEINAIAIPRDSAHVQLVGAAILTELPGDRGRRSDQVAEGGYDRPTSAGENGRSLGKVSFALKRLGANERESVETSVERLRSLESYSVEESALLQSQEPSADRP